MKTWMNNKLKIKVKKEIMKIRHGQLKRKAEHVASDWKWKNELRMRKTTKALQKKESATEEWNETEYEIRQKGFCHDTACHRFEIGILCMSYPRKCLTDYRVHSMILDNDLARHEFDASPFTANDYISLQNFATWLTLPCKTQPKWNKNHLKIIQTSY